MKFLVIACLYGGALAGVGCADGRGIPTGPSATAGVSDLAALAASPRSGDLHVTKECSGYTGEAGSFCTITSSNVKAIEVDSRIIYLQPGQLFTPSGSDVVLDPPGPGENTAFGHCSLPSACARFRAGPGSSPHSKRVSMSRIIPTSRSGTGKGRTASIRTIESMFFRRGCSIVC